MLKKPGMILLAVGISSLLGSCHVEQKDVEIFESTDNTLRIYQPSDVINYRVQISSPNGTQFGTLKIEWADPDQAIQNPLTQETYSVLKETTTLTIDDEEPSELIRYIEQDSDNGSMFLRALDTAVANNYYWLSKREAVPPDTLERFEIFRSPMPDDSSLPLPGEINLNDFYTLGDCTGTDCPTRIAFSSFRTFQVTARGQRVETIAATFTNAYTVSYRATVNREATTPLLDILAVCGESGITAHDATLHIVPEIGIVKIENTCTDLSATGASSVIYIITMERTNIPLP